MKQLLIIGLLLASAIFASAQTNFYRDYLLLQDSVVNLYKEFRTEQKIARFNVATDNYYIQQVQDLKKEVAGLKELIHVMLFVDSLNAEKIGYFNGQIDSVKEVLYRIPNTYPPTYQLIDPKDLPADTTLNGGAVGMPAQDGFYPESWDSPIPLTWGRNQGAVSPDFICGKCLPTLSGPDFIAPKKKHKKKK